MAMATATATGGAIDCLIGKWPDSQAVLGIGTWEWECVFPDLKLNLHPFSFFFLSEWSFLMILFTFLFIIFWGEE